jgi:hypothetical protein
MNIKEEFLGEIKGKEVKCAVLIYDSYNEDDKIEKILKIGCSSDDLEDFLAPFDFHYDCGYGTQMVYGTIWYIDGTWSERAEYDGSEWWRFMQCPPIPENLK